MIPPIGPLVVRSSLQACKSLVASVAPSMQIQTRPESDSPSPSHESLFVNVDLEFRLVHFPADPIAGLLWGGATGMVVVVVSIEKACEFSVVLECES